MNTKNLARSIVALGLAGCVALGLSFNATPEKLIEVQAAPDESPNTNFPIKNPIDKFILDKLNEEKVPPSGVCTDEEFIRRAYLDVVGVIPTSGAVKKFLTDRSPKKREHLVDELLSDSRYGMNWQVMWSDLLREHTNGKQQEGTEPGSYRDWIRKELNDNIPYNKFVSDLITATGRAENNGAVNFFLRDERDRVETVNTVAGVFMGTRMACAQCHDHPFDKWEQKDFHYVMAFFEPRTAVMIDDAATLAEFKADKSLPADVQAAIKPFIEEAEKAYAAEEALEKKVALNNLNGGPGMGAPAPGMMMNMGMAGKGGPIMRRMEESVKKDLGQDKAERLRQALNRHRVNKVVERPVGEYRMPADGDSKDKKNANNEMIQPQFPWDRTAKVDPKGARRTQLAALVTGSHRFAEVQVNRIFDQLMGRGIVFPTDDFREKNPPTNPELLTWLADTYIKSNYDNKAMIKLIMSSSAYERSSKPLDANRKDNTLYSHQHLRRMSAEQVFDSILIATGRKDGIRDLGGGKRGMEMMDAEAGGKKGGMRKVNADEMKWAADMPTPARNGSFLNIFNQPDREQQTQERDGSGSITQALEMLNGNAVNNAVLAKQGSYTNRLMELNLSGDELAQEMYLTVLSRFPNSEERRVANMLLRGSPSKEVVEDYLWALINTREFMFIK